MGKNKNTVRYTNTKSSTAKYSRRLVASYTDWMDDMTCGLHLQETSWKLRSLGSKKQVKQYIKEMRDRVRDDHVERVLGLEKAELLLRQLEGYYNDQQMEEQQQAEENQVGQDEGRHHKGEDENHQTKEVVANGGTANANAENTSISAAEVSNNNTTTTIQSVSSRGIERNIQQHQRRRLLKEQRHALEDSDEEEEEALFEDVTASKEDKEQTSSTLTTTTKAARRHVLDDSDSDDDDDEQLEEGKQDGKKDDVLPEDSSNTIKFDDIGNDNNNEDGDGDGDLTTEESCDDKQDYITMENSNKKQTEDLTTTAMTREKGKIDEKFNKVLTLLEGDKTAERTLPEGKEEKEEQKDEAVGVKERDNYTKNDRIVATGDKINTTEQKPATDGNTCTSYKKNLDGTIDKDKKRDSPEEPLEISKSSDDETIIVSENAKNLKEGETNSTVPCASPFSDGSAIPEGEDNKCGASLTEELKKDEKQ